MAIDPATAKLLAQIALKAATDEEARKKIIMIALIPIVSVLLIADNKTAEYADWNLELLAQELEDLKLADYDLRC